jgi:glutamate--cysteine ligase
MAISAKTAKILTYPQRVKPMLHDLKTTHAEPLQQLEARILEALPTIEHWFRQQWQDHTAPFYTSVDLRNAGFKLAPVDTNLFPGGFNNLREDFQNHCIHAAMSAVESVCPDTRQFLLIPENHTRNQYYLQNVANLACILQKAGFSIRIGSLLPEIDKPTPITLDSGHTLLLEPLVRQGSRLTVEGFDPCAILLNNDLTAGIPDILKGLSQKIVPPLFAGWHQRRKSRHFEAYNRVVNAFSEVAKIDPWLINPLFDHASNVDFASPASQEELAHKAEVLLNQVAEKYREHDVKEAPFLIMKADAGTYGMGIMTIRSPQDVLNLNRKQRNKLSVIKDGHGVSEVLLQEGVYTFETVDSQVAEPVVYMMGHFVVGGFYRVHGDRGLDENLNAPGARFISFPFENPTIAPEQNQSPDANPNRFYTYGVVARLAMLAASVELEEMGHEVEEQ